MTGAPDWLELCRRLAADAAAAIERHPDRSEEIGRGAGGDITLAIDRAAEDAVFAGLEGLDSGLTVISEERGEVDLNGGGSRRVVIDPIDGSRNARRDLPLYALSLAVAEGPAMSDVSFAYVHDFGRAEHWWAHRGGGAFLEGEPLQTAGGDELDLLGLEHTHPTEVAGAASGFASAGPERLRALGSVAMSLCYVAAGSLDAMLTLSETRSVDVAAGQLLVREAGGSVAFPEAGDLGASLGLDMRSRVLAAQGPGGLERLQAAFP
ncbi:MAG: hypothetical protein M3350_09785 [Actinomycetota bacterium]|nr:hypothetical protein [Actinomycetota bacterium]